MRLETRCFFNETRNGKGYRQERSSVDVHIHCEKLLYSKGS